VVLERLGPFGIVTDAAADDALSDKVEIVSSLSSSIDSQLFVLQASPRKICPVMAESSSIKLCYPMVPPAFRTPWCSSNYYTKNMNVKNA
jgi:hypothetical protein